MKIIPLIILAMAVLGFGCQGKKKNSTTEDSGMAVVPAWSLEELWETDTVLLTCESVRYDAVREQLYVSCINGEPWVKNGQGFIALVNLDGSVKSERWVTGLDAPKGMGIFGGKLYVADMDQIVVIDIENGEIREKIPVPGATQLNDVAVDVDGKVYFSDSGEGWIWTLEKGNPEPWIGDLKRPNGLYVEKDRVLLASSGSQDLRSISLENGKQDTLLTQIGHGDGVEFAGMEGHYIVTSWSGEIFLVLPDYTKISLLRTEEQGINSADIGFNRAEQTVYVPTFFKNRVVAYKLVRSDG